MLIEKILQRCSIRRRKGFLRLVVRYFLMTVFCSFIQAHAATEDNKVDESSLRTAYLYNFVKFFSWPEGFLQDNIEMTICVADPSTEILQQLDTLEGRLVGKQAIHIRVVSRSMEVRTELCEVLYFSEGAYWADDVNDRPVLTISDQPITDSGAMISFSIVENKLRFEINLRRVRNSRLDASSYLLKLATEVYE